MVTAPTAIIRCAPAYSDLDSHRANLVFGNLYTARECSFYISRPHLLSHGGANLEPDASYLRAHRLHSPKNSRGQALNRRTERASEGQ